MDLKDKVVFVTGSSQGLGAAVAVQVAEKGGYVIINYSSNQDAAQEISAQCEALGVQTLIVQGNVQNDDDCRRMVKEAVDKFGRLDCLVNNAGTTKFCDHADLEGLTAEDFTNIYSVNVIGAFQMTRAAAPHMKAVGHGAVVNVSSIAGVVGIGSSVAYAASKGALNTMTVSLARALAPEIRVNAVCPGFIGTGWFKNAFGEEFFDKMVAQQERDMPLKRAGTPEDIAKSVLWLMEGSDHITGETLISDGGLHLGYAPFSMK
ncbi:MAG: glucose 1-dehydrogenase [Amylibacter sp.]